MPGRWTASVAEARTRQLALLFAAGATACWVWFGYALRGAATEGLEASVVGVSMSLALAVVTTCFAAAFTAVACLASLAAGTGDATTASRRTAHDTNEGDVR